MAENLVIVAILLAPFCFGLAVCGFIADYVLPCCPRLTRFLERLFDVDMGGNDL